MVLKTGFNLIQNSGQKRAKSRLRKFSKRDKRALEAITSSGAFDQGGLTTTDVLHEHGMFKKGESSLPIGVHDGRILRDNLDSPIAILSRPGGGKGTCLGFPMMAEWKHSSFTLDVDCEYVRSVSPFRRSLGHKQIFLNACGLYGFPSDCLNPFRRLIRLVQEDIHAAIAEARELAQLIVPDTPAKQQSQNNWIDKGARKLIEMALIYLAKDRPYQCTLAGLLEFLSQPIPAMLDAIGMNATIVFAVKRATTFVAEYFAEAQKQVQWKVEEACEALQIIQPGSPYDLATSASSFDPRSVKTADQPIDIYLMVEGRRLETEANYLSLLMSHIIEEAANAPGDRPFLVLADEFSQLAKSRVLIKAMRAYRKRKIKIVTMSQGRQSTIDRYGQNLAHDIEDMAGTKIWIDPPYQIARELSQKGGYHTATSRNIGDAPDGRYTTSYSESAQPNLPVSELVSGSGALAGKMIIEHKGVPGLIVADKVPWWEIYPYAEQLSNDYRDDFYQYQPPPVRVSRDEALAMFGLSDPFMASDVTARARLLQGSFPQPIINAALNALGGSQ
ncbi:MAG: type IV secretory system conjugative DNA transfer family protein [Pseudomonadota bacterium]